MGFKIINGDITNVECEAIVNAANSYLKMGGGVCGAIFNKAGARQLTQECNQIGYCKPGNAVITKGYNLKAKYIIHAVGPIYQDGKHNEKEILEAAYYNSLLLAKQYHLNSIAFPLISSGIYGYPYDEALMIAKNTISNFLLDNDMEVYLVLYK